jgi:D-alanyl-D-alanine carboxypeptidase
MQRPIALLALSVILSAPILGASMQESSRSAASQLQALLEEGVSKGIPGISAAVATSKGVVWTGTAGKANLDTGEPVQPDMLFGIGSITKTFVAVVILQLMEEGKLRVDDTAAGILGKAVEGIPNADKATIAQLLNHTGGVPSWEDDPVWIREGRGKDLDPKRLWGKPDTLAYIKGHAPLFPAGEKFSYANTNYTLLGMIIEKLTGQDAVSEIQRRILTPLGLKNIYLEGFEPVPADKLPRRYHWATPDFIKTAGVNEAFPEVRLGLIDASASNLSVEWTAGGMVATARDLALYGAALRDGELLKPESMKFMLTWFPKPAWDGAQVGHNVFRTQIKDGTVVIGHDGDVLGFTGSLYWVEGADAVVAVVTNVGSMHTGTSPGGAYSVGKAVEFVRLVTRL